MKKPFLPKITSKEYVLAIIAFVYSIVLAFIIINGAVGDDNNKNYFCMFTNQSNIMCDIWLFCFFLSIFFVKNKKFYLIVRNRVIVISILLNITMTFLIVALWLNPIWKGQWLSGISMDTFYSHLITPLVMWLMMFFVKFEGKYSWKHNFYTLIYPLAFFFIFGLGSFFLNGWVPYNFLDPTFYGHTDEVTTWVLYTCIIIILAAVFYGASYGIYRLKTAVKNKIPLV